MIQPCLEMAIKLSINTLYQRTGYSNWLLQRRCYSNQFYRNPGHPCNTAKMLYTAYLVCMALINTQAYFQLFVLYHWKIFTLYISYYRGSIYFLYDFITKHENDEKLFLSVQDETVHQGVPKCNFFSSAGSYDG